MWSNAYRNDQLHLRRLIEYKVGKSPMDWQVALLENIIEASFRALIDSVEYKLMKEKATVLS